jgi:hypothetical protein
MKKELDTHTDYLLTNFVKSINGTDNFMGITLCIAGLLISGELVSGHKYFENIGDEFSRLPNAENDTKEVFYKLGNLVYPKKEEQTAEEEPITITFIHLRNAHIFLPGSKPIPTNSGAWWRGKVDSIDGFFIGSLSLME